MPVSVSGTCGIAIGTTAETCFFFPILQPSMPQSVELSETFTSVRILLNPAMPTRIFLLYHDPRNGPSNEVGAPHPIDDEQRHVFATVAKPSQIVNQQSLHHACFMAHVKPMRYGGIFYP
ncbi:hypothetical protein ACMFMF_000832 [Clarireedia jacksonii]